LIDGQEHAFLMTPEGSQVPEPSMLLIFGLTSAAFALRTAGFPRELLAGRSIRVRFAH